MWDFLPCRSGQREGEVSVKQRNGLTDFLQSPRTKHRAAQPRTLPRQLTTDNQAKRPPMIHSLHLTLDEYDGMVRKGAFDELGRKVELIRGELVEMNPAGPLHDDYIAYLTTWSGTRIDPAKNASHRADRAQFAGGRKSSEA
jgi:hypothetical protein